MEAIIIIAVIVLIGAAFFLGRKLASKPVENRNEEILKEKNQYIREKELAKERLNEYQIKVEKEINKLDASVQTFIDTNKQLSAENTNLQTSISANKQLNTQIQKEYEDKLQVIKDTEKLAEKAHKDKVASLDKDYAKYQETIESRKTVLQETIDKIQAELDSLKATKAAAIEAARNEKTVKENKDEYCLILPRDEEGDISLLTDVRNKISKPRAVSMCIWSNYYLPIAKEKLPKILGTGQTVSGIYKITNQKTGECYIGQSVDVKKRIYEHMRAACGVDTPSGNQLYIAMQEYGISNFTIELLEQCSSKELDKKEKYFIELYQANVVGYNGNAGNNG